MHEEYMERPRLQKLIPPSTYTTMLTLLSQTPGERERDNRVCLRVREREGSRPRTAMIASSPSTSLESGVATCTANLHPSAGRRVN